MQSQWVFYSIAKKPNILLFSPASLGFAELLLLMWVLKTKLDTTEEEKITNVLNFLAVIFNVFLIFFCLKLPKEKSLKKKKKKEGVGGGDVTSMIQNLVA